MDSIADKLAIQDLNNLYAYYIDMFEVDKWVDCFTKDAVFDETGVGNDVRTGHDPLRAFALRLTERVHRVVHLMSNHIIMDQTKDTARGECFAVVEVAYADGQRFRNHVRYVDRYKKVDGAWKIENRKAYTTFPREMLEPMTLQKESI